MFALMGVEGRRAGEELNEEQTATLETALLHAGNEPRRADPDANRSAGLQSCRVSLASSHQGLVELARRRSDLSVHSSFVVCARKISSVGLRHATAAQGLRLTWPASNWAPLVITAQRDARVLVGQCHRGDLPARSLP